MANISKKAYIWVKYLFFFGCDPIQSTIVATLFTLISTFAYFGLYELFKALISNEYMNCHTYLKGAILNPSIKVDIAKCSVIDLHLSSKEATVFFIFFFGLFVFFSFIIGNKNNSNPFTQDEGMTIELRKIDEEEKKKKQ